MNSGLLLSQRRKKLLVTLESQMPLILKRRMSWAVLVLIILAANAALAVAANVIVRLVTN
jgi:hypothetical protein